MNRLENPITQGRKHIGVKRGRYDVQTLSSEYKMSRLYSEKYGEGIIESVSPQGDILYIIARELRGIDGAEGRIIGNKADLPEDQLTASEVLIPLLDVAPWELRGIGYTSLVGRIIKVKYVGGHPVGAMTAPRGPATDKPRAISAHDIWNARATESDKILKDNKSSPGYIYLLGKGYTKEEIELTLEDTVDKINPGSVMYYGEADWNSSAQVDTNTMYRVPATTNAIVNGLPKSQLKRKACHRFTGALGG